MKKRLVSHLMLGFSLAALPFLDGCSQHNAGGSSPFLTAANAEPTLSETNLALVPPATTNLPVAALEADASVPTPTKAPAAAQTNAPALAEAATTEPAPVAELKPPPNVRLSPVLGEVVKLVQSGVDETVLLSYITNTTGYFALGAEEIVYLNDLGVEGEVLTTMMHHDQALRELRMNAVQAAQAAATIQVAQQEVEPEIAAAPSYVNPPAMEAEPVCVSDNYFNGTLAPYGSWVYVSGYGRCWRPTVGACNPGWRPYCDRGRWVYSDCGWYWLSDYTWGATTFHYGRWFNHANWGWCWYPDNVWAPSWVSWRYSGDYCGWAPLPPTACYQPGAGLMFQYTSVADGFGFGLGFNSYNFVPWGNFCSPRPYQYRVPASRAYQVYNTTTPVNHLEAGGHGKVYNRGIPPANVGKYARTEVRTVSIREQTGRGPRAERLDRDGRTLAVHRPTLVPASTPGGSNLEPAGRGAGRNGSWKGNDGAVTQTPLSPTSISPSTAGRTEVKTGRDYQNRVRSVERPASTVPPTALPVVETKPAVATPSRVETRPGREREQPIEAVTANRVRAASPVAVRPPEISAKPVIPAAPGPKVPQPRVIQTSPQATPRPTAPASSSSVIVIGGRNNTRSSGRDYVVYGTPTPSPSPSAPTSSPRDNLTRSTASPIVSTPETVAENSSATRTQTERSRPSRSESGRSENRGSYSAFSTPQVGQVIPPTARSAPSYTPRSAPSSPAPGYTPRPTQSAAPSAPRVESRPAPAAPAAPTTIPATTRSGSSQGQSRPNR
jgi:hypothetical protein